MELAFWLLRKGWITCVGYASPECYFTCKTSQSCHFIGGVVPELKSKYFALS
jgi:hypothetical protein